MKSLLLFLFILSTELLACMNSSYSRSDESQITDQLAYIIIGEFAHHGDAFYLKELKRTAALMKTEPIKFEDSNDHAVALVKLKRYEEAEKELLKNDELFPNRYKTHSNLAVLYKKMGSYKKAESSLKKALLIQPEGHMGLGDYYLKMIQFLAKKTALKNGYTTENDIYNNINLFPYETLDDKNFLAHSYAMSPTQLIKQSNVRKDYLITLIKNDYSFADTYLILGDVLMTEGNYQMALRAYFRASQLNKNLYKITEARIEKIFELWNANKEEDYVVDNPSYTKRELRTEINMAEYWLEEFKKTEAELLANSERASFSTIRKAMQRKEIEHQKIVPLGYYKGEKKADYHFWSNIIGATFFFSLCFGVILIIIKLIQAMLPSTDSPEQKDLP